MAVTFLSSFEDRCPHCFEIKTILKYGLFGPTIMKCVICKEEMDHKECFKVCEELDRCLKF